MPLPKTTPRDQRMALLWTFGPYPHPGDEADTHRAHIFNLFTGVYATRMKQGQFMCAFEKSEDEYEHCHVAVGFTLETKPSMKLVKQLKALCVPDSEGREPNLGINHVPKKKKGDHGAGKSAYGVLQDYLANPVKKKSVDYDAIDFKPPDTRNLMHELRCYEKYLLSEADPWCIQYYQRMIFLVKLDIKREEDKTRVVRLQRDVDAQKAALKAEEDKYRVHRPRGVLTYREARQRRELMAADFPRI